MPDWFVDECKEWADKMAALATYARQSDDETLLNYARKIQGRATMKQRSAGLLLFRRAGDVPEIFLVHPGGPFWAKKDDGAWSIPKGLYEEGENPLVAAKREFGEETSFSVDGEFIELGEFKQPSGKWISAWAIESDCDPADLKSNKFSMEWPPKSGRTAEFPEVDRAAWFRPREAMQKIIKGQMPIVETLFQRLGIAINAQTT